MPGGVCAVLDYDVEMMADYVSEMAIRVLTPDSSVTHSFRKFVTQILTSTRLPSTTILLGLNYLAKRVNTLKNLGPYKASEGQVWRYVTVSLLLGSKFLDDNTFQNRSWSEVSGIPVAELNLLEYEWVQAMAWRLYVNLDLSKDYQAWLENWKAWQLLKKEQTARAKRDRLASVAPTVKTEMFRYQQRHSPHSHYSQAVAAGYERHQASKTSHLYASRDAIWSNNPWNAPLTPPDSGYGTPEYNSSTTTSTHQQSDWFAQAAAQYPHRYAMPSLPGNYMAHPYANAYPFHHGAWEHGHGDCSCHNCLAPSKHAQYFASHGYGQTIMG